MFFSGSGDLTQRLLCQISCATGVVASLVTEHDTHGASPNGSQGKPAWRFRWVLQTLVVRPHPDDFDGAFDLPVVHFLGLLENLVDKPVL